MTEEQIELALPPIEDNNIYFESTTLSADVVLAKSINCFEDVFIIGLGPEGLEYRSNNGDVVTWIHALERAKQFILRNSY